MLQHRRIRLSFLSLLMGSLLAGGPVKAAETLVITPTTFDFGWCPDNAKISATFTIKNLGVDIIPITSVQPTCGCTAPHFTPGPLGSNQETQVSLTFNTLGYANAGSPGRAIIL